MLQSTFGARDDRVRQKRRIDERLAPLGEVQRIGRGRVSRLPERARGQRREAAAQAALRRIVGRQLDPGRQPGQRATQRLEVRDFSPVGRSFNRHGALQRARREVGQHRLGDARQPGDPARANGRAVGKVIRRARLHDAERRVAERISPAGLARRRSGRIPCVDRCAGDRRRHGHSGALQEIASMHDHYDLPRAYGGLPAASTTHSPGASSTPAIISEPSRTSGGPPSPIRRRR